MLRKIAAVLGMVVLLGVLSLGVNYWAYTELQKRLEVQIHGEFIPLFFIPAFELRHGNFSWEDRVQLVDGNFKVTFDPLTLVSQRGLRIIVKSRDSKIRFLGNWALQQGVEAATVDSMTADIILGRRGLAGINEVEVMSKSFQFSLKNADKLTTKKTEVS